MTGFTYYAHRAGFGRALMSLSFVVALAVPLTLQAQSAAPPKPPNEADVEFITGMIHHHAQAVLIAGWAPSHGASPAVQRLCERIINAQNDEITIMQNWLKDRGLPAEPATAGPMKMKMGGMEHTMLMPGMLSEEQLKTLDQARGAEFDKLFLKDMIQHHQGAIGMVETLRTAYGAAQDELVFRFSSDVYADQTTEIDRMQKMLTAMEMK